KLAPAKMATGSVKLDGFNRNRHTKIEPKPVDRELGVLRLDDLSGKPIAVLVNFAAHPTMAPASTLKFCVGVVPVRPVLPPLRFDHSSGSGGQFHAGRRG